MEPRHLDDLSDTEKLATVRNLRTVMLGSTVLYAARANLCLGCTRYLIHMAAQMILAELLIIGGVIQTDGSYGN